MLRKFLIALSSPLWFGSARADSKAVRALDYDRALEYTLSWASFINNDLFRFTVNEHEFHGTLGSLDFSYTTEEHVLHVWSFISPGAAPLLTRRADMREMIEQRHREHPEDMDGGVFDIRVLDWNKQVGKEPDPCLWLRLDIVDASLSPKQMTKKLDHFSIAGYLWNRGKLSEVQNEYWAKHPKEGKRSPP